MDEITIPNDASPETLKAVSLHCATMIGVQHGWDHERVLAIAHLFHEFVDPCGVERNPS